MALADAVAFFAAGGGAGTFHYGAAADSYRTPEQAFIDGDIVDNGVYSYFAQAPFSSPTQREWGEMTYHHASQSFTRSPAGGVDNGADTGTSPVSFSDAPFVAISALEVDFGSSVGANPTATASNVAVNGVATTFMRSDAAPAVQKASAAQFGLVEVDGTTITASSGVISSVPYPLAGGNLDFYVATTGSDSNPGTIGSPFATIQHAVEVAQSFDYQGLYAPTIHVAAGTYDEVLFLGDLVNVQFFDVGGTIIGAGLTSIIDASSFVSTINYGITSRGLNSIWTIRNFKLSYDSTDQYGLFADGFSFLVLIGTFEFNDTSGVNDQATLVGLNNGGRIQYFAVTVTMNVGPYIFLSGSSGAPIICQIASSTIVLPSGSFGSGGFFYNQEQNAATYQIFFFNTFTNAANWTGPQVKIYGIPYALFESPNASFNDIPGDPTLTKVDNNVILANFSGTNGICPVRITAPPVSADLPSDTWTVFKDTTQPAGDGVSEYYNDAGTLVKIGPYLTTATGNKTWYVATTGSDSNPGTALLPFATVQHAAIVAGGYDYQNLYAPTINVAAGTYSMSAVLILGDILHSGTGGIVGASPATTTFDFGANGYILSNGFSANWYVDGFTFQGSNAGGGRGFYAQNYSFLEVGASLGVYFNDVSGGNQYSILLSATSGSVQIFGTTFTCISGFGNFTFNEFSTVGFDFMQVADCTVVLPASSSYFSASAYFLNNGGDGPANFAYYHVTTVNAGSFIGSQVAMNNGGFIYLLTDDGTLGPVPGVSTNNFIDNSLVLGNNTYCTQATLQKAGAPGSGDVFPGAFAAEKDTTAPTGAGNRIVFNDAGTVYVVGGGAPYAVSVPTAGGTVTATQGLKSNILNPAGTLATLTVDLPTGMIDGETTRVSTSQIITAITFATTDLSAIVGAPAAMAAGSAVQFLFDPSAGANGTWYIN